MGTISDKLTYLNGTKTAIKNAIIEKGGTVGNNDTFRSYANKIRSLPSGQANLQNKVVNPSIQQQVISADIGYDGLNQVTISAVTSAIDNNIQANNIKKNVSILGVTGTLEASTGGVKLFETVDEMQQDETAQDDDIAIILGERMYNCCEDSFFSSVVFPKEVEFSDSVSLDFFTAFHPKSVDMGSCEINVTWNGMEITFDVNDGDTEESILYVSSDGCHYVRDDSIDDDITINFSSKICHDNLFYWDDKLGNFMQLNGKSFEGVYKYSSEGGYEPLETQLDATVDDVESAKVFYGKYGVQTGMASTEKFVIPASADSNRCPLILRAGTSLNLDLFDFSNATTLARMCQENQELTDITFTPNTNLSRCVNLDSAFSYCPLNKESIKKVIEMCCIVNNDGYVSTKRLNRICNCSSSVISEIQAEEPELINEFSSLGWAFN